MKIISKFCFVGASLLATTATMANEYPFTLPENTTAKIHITTSEQEAYKNPLLGTNIFNFISEKEQSLINMMAPLTIRFPHGLWANWYDWRADHTRLYGTESFEYTALDGSKRTKTVDHLASIKIFEAAKTKIGIDGLTDLNTIRKADKGEGFDMVWTFNMSADGEDGSGYNNGSPETVARYNDLVARGFNVDYIELGNENFYPGQRSSIIPEVNDYILRAKSMSAALKALDPNIQLSIPLLRRDNWANPNWNEDLTKDLTYFDAVTVHTYVGHNPDDPENGDSAYSTALTARHHIAASVNDYSKKVAPNKPIWLTEWGVQSGGANAASVLGMADSYIFMSENQDTYHRANWFSVNGKLNSFFVWEEYVSPSGVVRPRIKYPLEYTAYGATYKILRSALENSTMLSSTIDSPELISGVNAISARALLHDDKITLLVLNLTDKNVPFNAVLDGNNYSGGFTHSAITFNTLDEEKLYAVDSDPATLIKDGSGNIELPKYSINTIVLKDSSVTESQIDVYLQDITNGQNINVSDTLSLSANATVTNAEIEKVQFSINGEVIATDEIAPYAIDWTPTAAGTFAISATAFTNNGLNKTSENVNIVVSQPVPQISVTVTSPTNSQEFTLPNPVSLTADATTDIGQIDYVEFRVNGNALPKDETAPFTANWQPTSAGTYTVEALAMVAGTSKISTSMAITIKAAATPDPETEPTPPNNNSSDGSSGGSTSPLHLLMISIALFCKLTSLRKLSK